MPRDYVLIRAVQDPTEGGSYQHPTPTPFGHDTDWGERDYQEDTAIWHSLSPNDLTASQTSTLLSPVQIGHRLWTTYQLLDRMLFEQHTRHSGTTATTLVYDGKEHFITASIADSSCFVLVYGHKGQFLGVRRLNSVTHKPDDATELERINASHGFVKHHRLNGQLAISRAIGDFHYQGSRGKLAPPDASIDIISKTELLHDMRINPLHVGFFQTITASDGFTDGALRQTKQGHQSYIRTILEDIETPGLLTDNEMATLFLESALRAGSVDNITVTVTRVITGKAYLQGIYDGHGGDESSIFVATQCAKIFKEQCQLSLDAYANHSLSVNHLHSLYSRDNTDPVAQHMPIMSQSQPIIDNKNQLISIVEQLMKNITTHSAKGSRLTIGTISDEKVKDLNSILDRLKQETDAINTDSSLSDYVDKIKAACKKRRHTLHFWATPHSEGECDELLKTHKILCS